MLYLLRSFGKGEKSVLKLGYASDIDRRYYQYESYNPYIERAGMREGDLLSETKYHLYLHYLGYSEYKDEWYKDCQEVIDIFNTDENEIDMLLWKSRGKLYKKIQLFTDNGVFNFLVEKFGDSSEDFNNDDPDNVYFDMILSSGGLYKSEKDILLDQVSNNELRVWFSEFLQDGIFTRRMKMICEIFVNNNSRYEEVVEVLNKFGHDKYDSYLRALGVDFIKANSYQEHRLRNEMMNKSRDNKLSEEIYNFFTVGESYSLKYVKESLKKIYDDCGIKRNPKATDLEEYFSIKTGGKVQVSGKWENGLKILKAKE